MLAAARRRRRAHARLPQRPLGDASATCATLGARAARLLRPARAPQADARRRAAGDPRRALRRASRRCACAPAPRPSRETVRLRRASSSELRELAGARERELDLLEFELAEIDAAAPDEREHDELLARARAPARVSTRSARRPAPAPRRSPPTIGRGARRRRTLLAAAVARLEALAGRRPAPRRARRAPARAGDRVAGPRRRAARLQRRRGRRGWATAPGEAAATLDGVEERLAAIERLMRKHGGSIAVGARARGAAPARAATSWRAPRSRSSRPTERLREARGDARRARCGAARARARRPRRALARGGARAARLAGDGGRALRGRARASASPGPSGGDAVEFLIAPTPASRAAPLREIASGGELSRVMLALVTACRARAAGTQRRARRARADRLPAADARLRRGRRRHRRAHGARRRARACASSASSRQVLCITHLPQIASLGDRHFSIVKDTAARPDARDACVAAGRGARSSPSSCGCSAPTRDDSVARRHARELRRAA